MSRRQRLKLLAGLVLIGLVVGWPVGSHYRAKARVRAYVESLRAAGEKMTIPELTPPVSSDDLQRATTLVGVARRLGTVPLIDTPPCMRYVAPGRTLLTWAQPLLPTSESSDLWPGLSRAVEQQSDRLAELRAALNAGHFAVSLDYSQGYALLLPHLSALKGSAQWLAAAAICALHEGRPDEASENVVAMASLIAEYRDEPVMISELVRIAAGQIALNATWEALQSPQWQDSQLQALQARWESVDLVTQAEGVLEMERVTSRQVLAKARESMAVLNNLYGSSGTGTSTGQGINELAELGKQLLKDPGDAFKEMSRYPRYWVWRHWGSYEDELVNVQALQAALEAVRRARAEKVLDPALQEFDTRIRRLRQAHPKAGTWLDFTMVLNGGLDRFFSRITALERQRSLLVAAIALKRYELQHHAFPPDLASLVPAFLPAVPRDAVCGQPLQYRLEPGGTFRLYSFGEDGRDDGGDPSLHSAQATNTTYRQWWRARDAVWPQPATADELKDYFQRLKPKLTTRDTTPEQAAALAAFARRYGLPPPTPGPTNGAAAQPGR